MTTRNEQRVHMVTLKSPPAVRKALTLCGVGLVLATGLNPAAAHADDGCRRICITDLQPNGSTMHVAWDGNEPFASYEVYWELKGTTDIRTEKVGADQFAFDIPGVQPAATYRVQVLGCSAATPWYSDGPCTAVDQRIIST